MASVATLDERLRLMRWLAAVGLTEGLVVLVFSIALGLSMAATATVARYPCSAFMDSQPFA